MDQTRFTFPGLRGWVREQGRLLGEPSRQAHTRVGPVLGLMLRCPILKFLMFEQGSLHFHFVLDLPGV